MAVGRAFLLQAGDCAESFHEFSADSIRDKLKVILQMALVLTYGGGVPVVKVGRIAGQFAKPRSSATEVVDGQILGSFRGHAVNEETPTEVARVPDPTRMVKAYHQAAATLNLLRSFTKGGFGDLAQLHTWNQEFVVASPAAQRYDTLAEEIDRALRFIRDCGVQLGCDGPLQQVDFWTSHEALLLGYEEAMTRQDSLSGAWYDTSAHMVWVGERTRSLDGSHIDFLSGISNPVAAKIGPMATAAEVVGVCDRLDPHRTPGRLTLIMRLGADRIRALLPPLLQAVGDAGHPVVWACDPMHGNTFSGAGGRKTRHFDHILREVREFFDVCRSHGVWPGGIHVELTGEDVTECLGGTNAILEGHLGRRYTTACDPRLNVSQALDLAFQVAEFQRQCTGLA